MKRAVRYILFSLGLLFTGLSLVILGISAKQISKNRLELADMRDRVASVKQFYTERGRLPDDEELHALSASLPVRYSAFHYIIATTPEKCDFRLPGQWKAGDWAMSYWRGEWWEHYSSWDDHYTLAAQASWWGFCGFLLFLPVVALLFFSATFIPFLSR